MPRKTKGEDDGSQDRQVIVSGIDTHARRERSVALNSAATGLRASRKFAVLVQGVDRGGPT